MAKSESKKTSTAILGACGEHFVASYLSGFRLIVALPRAGVPGCDLLVAGEKVGHAVRIQVKTGTQSTTTNKVDGPIYLWHTSYNVIENNDKHLWYAYVYLRNWPHGEEQPELFFVPSRVVIETMTECKKLNENPSFFWMKVGDASKYRGRAGLQAILDDLKSPAELLLDGDSAPAE
ncbi:MAG: hypothetical protein EXS05_04125 [Planctomycetaceae bacterium]|nr:hypothetical protein [Planctomycetaceae bacterium]